MPQQLTDYFTADDYTAAGTIGGLDGGARQTRFAGYNQSYIVQFAVYTDPERTQTAIWKPDEYVYAANTGDVFGTEVAGARFRSYVLGQPAEIYASIAYDGDPLASAAPPAVPSTAPTAGSPYRIITQRHHVIAAAGTPGNLLTTQPCSSISVRADPTNVGLIYLGGPTLGIAGAVGYRLSPGDAVAFAIGNANEVFLDGDNNGDGASWFAVG